MGTLKSKHLLVKIQKNICIGNRTHNMVSIALVYPLCIQEFFFQQLQIKPLQKSNKQNYTFFRTILRVFGAVVATSRKFPKII